MNKDMKSQKKAPASADASERIDFGAYPAADNINEDNSGDLDGVGAGSSTKNTIEQIASDQFLTKAAEEQKGVRRD